MRYLPIAIVIGTSLLLAIAYRGEVTLDVPEANDAVFHLGLIDNADRAWEAGENPRDPWIEEWGQGFPVLRYYQHLPHYTVVVAHQLTGVSTATLYHVLIVLCLALLPLSFYWGARMLGLAPHASALAGVCAAVVGVERGVRYLYGFQAESFLWLGAGLFTQLFAMVFFMPALGAIYRFVRTGRYFGVALALVWATVLSHLLIGYMLCLLGALVLVLDRKQWRRLLVLYAAVGVVVAYVVVPTVLDGEHINHSVWESATYWDSFGMGETLERFATGGLLGGVLTLLAVAGGVIAWRRKGVERVIAIGFVVMFVLYFGRAPGPRNHILPFASDMPLHRFIVAVQICGVMLAGVALGALWDRIGWERSRARAAIAFAGAALLLAPAIYSTVSFARQNHAAREFAAADAARNRAPLDRVLSELVALDRKLPGRGYAGASWNWGKDYKLAGTPVYLTWSQRGLASISYMVHTMSTNSDLEPLFDERRQDHYDLFNVRWLMAYDRALLPPFSKLLFEEPGVFGAAVVTRGYFDVVGVDRFLDRSQLTFDFNKRFIASRWHAAGRYVHIGDTARAGEIAVRADEPFADTPFTRPNGHVVKQTDRVAEVELAQPGHVLFRMTYHPGWRARVDGKLVDTVMLSPSFVGIPVTAGVHRIEMSYAPQSRAWFWLGFLGVLAALARDVILRVRERKQPAA